ncbi:MAG: hypothetical protein IKO85_04170 [Bacteroidaceae bacterium]|nr:hypothetical protein [Bacteroidaceae bacterium]
MKKILLAIGLFGMTAIAIHAEDVVTAQNCTLRATGTESAIIELSTEVENYRGFQADVVLPVGITVTGIADAGRGVETENVDVNKRFGKAESIEVEDVVMQKQTVVFAISCNFKTGDGALLSLTLAADETVTAGTYTGYLKNVLLSYSTGTTVSVSESSFTIEVYEGNVHMVLDENSTTAPEASAEVADVTLKRTIKANQWSTICLPFSATGEQVKAAFGTDVALAKFIAWESEEDDDGAIIGIDVTFTTTDADDGIEANTPMLIRVSNNVTTATFEGVTLEPEEEPVVQVGKKASQRGYFYGTYISTLVPEENVFISGNKFWYSTGASTIKGYRGYFEFRDVLDAYYDAAAVKYIFFVDGDETQVNDIVNDKLSNGTLFDLSGRKVMKPAKSGLYIVNGKKTIIK